MVFLAQQANILLPLMTRALQGNQTGPNIGTEEFTFYPHYGQIGKAKADQKAIRANRLLIERDYRSSF
jgi:hypothetical protein